MWVPTHTYIYHKETKTFYKFIQNQLTLFSFCTCVFGVHMTVEATGQSWEFSSVASYLVWLLF